MVLGFGGGLAVLEVLAVLGGAGLDKKKAVSRVRHSLFYYASSEAGGGKVYFTTFSPLMM